MGEKRIPPEVIDKLLSDLESFVPRDSVSGQPTVKISANRARIFPQPKAIRSNFRTLRKGTESAFIGKCGDFVSLEYENAPYWTNVENVELPDAFGTILDQFQSNPPLAKIAKADALLFHDHALTRRLAVASTRNTEFPFLGVFGNSVCLERDNEPVWTHLANVEIDSPIWTKGDVSNLAVVPLGSTKGRNKGIFGRWGHTLE
jgi:hypothetical protein